MMLKNLPISPVNSNALESYVRVTTLLYIVLVFLGCYNCGLPTWINSFHQPLEVMLVTSLQLVIIRPMGKRVKSNFLVGYVNGIISFTFILLCMKPKKHQISLQLLILGFWRLHEAFSRSSTSWSSDWSYLISGQSHCSH